MDKIEKLRLKAKLAEDSGKHQKAYNIRKKIKELQAKSEYKKAKGPSGLNKIIKKVKKKSKEVIEKVKQDIPKIKKDKKPPVVKKDEKPPVVNADNPEGKPLKSINKNTSVTTSLSGTVGLAYGTDGKKGVGSVTKNGVTLKPGDEGFDAAAAELLAQSNKKEETIKRIKKNKKK